MIPLIRTKIHNPLANDKTYSFTEKRLFVAANSDLIVDYDIYTASVLDGKEKLLEADLATNAVVLTYLVPENVNVERTALAVIPDLIPVEQPPILNLAIDAERKAEKDLAKKQPEILKTKEQMEKGKPNTKFNFTDVVWKGDKAAPIQDPTPINLTTARENLGKAEANKGNRPNNVQKV